MASLGTTFAVALVLPAALTLLLAKYGSSIKECFQSIFRSVKEEEYLLGLIIFLLCYSFGNAVVVAATLLFGLLLAQFNARVNGLAQRLTRSLFREKYRLAGLLTCLYAGPVYFVVGLLLVANRTRIKNLAQSLGHLLSRRRYHIGFILVCLCTKSIYLFAAGMLLGLYSLHIRRPDPRRVRASQRWIHGLSLLFIFVESTTLDLRDGSVKSGIDFFVLTTGISVIVLFLTVAYGIRQLNDRSTLKYTSPEKHGKLVVTTIKDYDGRILRNALMVQGLQLLARFVVYSYSWHPLPLMISIYIDCNTMTNNELLRVYIWDESPCSRLERPWGRGSGDPVEQEASRSEPSTLVQSTYSECSSPRPDPSPRVQTTYSEYSSPRPSPTPWNAGRGYSSDSVSSTDTSLSTSTAATSVSSSSSYYSPPSPAPAVEKPGALDTLMDPDRYREWLRDISPYALQVEHRRARVTKYGDSASLGAHAVSSPFTSVATIGASSVVHAAGVAYHSGSRTLSSMQQKACEEEMARRGVGDLDWRKRDILKIATNIASPLKDIFN